MNAFAILGCPQIVVDRELLGVYSTREQAQALIDAQDPELRLWLRIEEATFDKNPDADFWKRPTARALVIADLSALVARMVAESGGQEGFDAKGWVLDWLTRSHPALGNRCPEELLDTEEGRQFLRDILGRQQSGAYS